MKEIQLTQGKVTQIGDEDFKWLNQWKWQAQKGSNTYYAVRRDVMINRKQGATIYMHRFILNIPKDMEADHRDSDGLNNQRYNLRVCTSQQNKFNQTPRLNGSSIFKGVYWHKCHNKWMSRIHINGKTKFLGYFNTELEAAHKYDEKCLEFFGEFARPNIYDEEKNYSDLRVRV